MALERMIGLFNPQTMIENLDNKGCHYCGGDLHVESDPSKSDFLCHFCNDEISDILFDGGQPNFEPKRKRQKTKKQCPRYRPDISSTIAALIA